MTAVKPRILELSHGELAGFVNSLGEPVFRAEQIMNWVYKKLVTSFAMMTDIPQALREKLEKEAVVLTLKPVEEKISADGMTRKALFELWDGETIESGFMMYAPAGVSWERGTSASHPRWGVTQTVPSAPPGVRALHGTSQRAR